MLLLLDNFDSFTYNIVHLFAKLGQQIEVIRNSAAIEKCIQRNPSALIIGPGPGTPKTAGISIPLMRHFMGKIPILGVCLGHQCLGELFGGETIRAKHPMHGMASQISHTQSRIFENIPQHFTAMRYHSLVVNRFNLPTCLRITAETTEGEIMGLAHETLPIESVQFHPESAGSEYGELLFRNFLDYCMTSASQRI